MSDHRATVHHAEFRALAIEASDEAAAFKPRPLGSYMVQLPRRGSAFLCRSALSTQSTLSQWTDAIVEA